MHQLKDKDCQSASYNKTQLCCLQETHFKYKVTNILKINGWRKIYHAKAKQEKADVYVLISERAVFKARKVIKYKEVHT